MDENVEDLCWGGRHDDVVQELHDIGKYKVQHIMEDESTKNDTPISECSFSQEVAHQESATTFEQQIIELTLPLHKEDEIWESQLVM